MDSIESFKNQAGELDRLDTLSAFRYHFAPQDEQIIYLDGNSLGKLPIRTNALLHKVVTEQWGQRMIRSWNENWMGLSQRLSSKIARIIGAEPDEVFVGDNTSANFYKLAFAALKFQKERNKIVSDNLNFPSDLYLLQGLVSHHFADHHINMMLSDDGISINTKKIEEILDHKTALLTLSHVVFKSAFMYDMGIVNELAHKYNTLVLWDLSHSGGSVPVRLNETNADMAVGCTYKYLNGGPGAPAYLYVRKDLQEKLFNPIQGWFGHNEPFAFNLDYKARRSIERFAVGTPGILSMAAMEPGLDLILEAGIENLRLKSMAQSTFMQQMIYSHLITLGFSFASPEETQHRGSHLSLQHCEGYRISKAMISPKDGSPIIIPDFRPPNNIRLGIAPLYNTFTELFETVIRMRTIVVEEQYKLYNETVEEVT